MPGCSLNSQEAISTSAWSQQRRSHGDEALSALRPCRDICEALIKRESENILWQRRLAYTINRIGQVLDHRGAGSRADALAAYREGYRIGLSLLNGCRELRRSAKTWNPPTPSS